MKFLIKRNIILILIFLLIIAIPVSFAGENENPDELIKDNYTLSCNDDEILKDDDHVYFEKQGRIRKIVIKIRSCFHNRNNNV